MESFVFDFGHPLARALHLVGVTPRTSGVQVDQDLLRVRFGPWRLATSVGNISAVSVSGPYSAWKAIGVRLSLSDRGLTFGTTTRAGVCISFRDPVPAALPWGLLRHPSLTVTVKDPERLAGALRTSRGR